jgi:hypothetical protein
MEGETAETDENGEDPTPNQRLAHTNTKEHKHNHRGVNRVPGQAGQQISKMPKEELVPWIPTVG